MGRATAQQFSLPCNIVEATTLAEQLAQAGYELTWRSAKLDALHEELAQAQADRDMWRHALREQERNLQTAHGTIRLLTSQLETARLLLAFQTTLHPPAAPGALPAWLDGALRTLLVHAHPDKWSAGQDATALAHEVSLQLNALRARLGEGH